MLNGDNPALFFPVGVKFIMTKNRRYGTVCS